MKVSYKLLQQFVDLTGIEIADFVQKVTIAGIEVEDVQPVAIGSQLIIGQVVECTLHPQSNHLHVCQVNIGKEVLQIVCGAQNVKAQQKVIVATVGAVLPAKGLTIQNATIRGVNSQGMICSLLELGVPEDRLSQESIEGIEVLPESAIIGDENPLAYLGLDDIMIEFKPTPNRGDVWSVISLAYDVSAILQRKFIYNQETLFLESNLPTQVSVHSNTPHCHYFTAKKVNDVVVKPSPIWLQNILLNSGIRPVNNIVDIGNYVMLVYGQPIHMYDADQLLNLNFTIEDSIQQAMVALDDSTYPIEPGDLVICAGKQPECIAGVMGAKNSMIQDSTKNIVVEAAIFNPISIRKTSRRLQLFSDSSTRFTRGIDETRTETSMQAAVKMLIDLAEAKTTEKTVTFGRPSPHNCTIEISINKVNRVLGTSYTQLDIASAFDRLRFSYTFNNGVFQVVVPFYRRDLVIPEDLIEEIVRILGFETISSKIPTSATIGQYSQVQSKRLLVKHYLLDNSIHEANSYSLVHQPTIDDFCLLPLNKNKVTYRLASPMSEDHAWMRKTLIPSLLQAIQYNQARKNPDVQLFEMAHVYPMNEEVELLSIALSGQFPSAKWREQKNVDFYRIKGMIEGIFLLLGFEEKRYNLLRVEKDNPYLHPGKSVYIVDGKRKIGFIGQIHPNMEKKYEIKETYVAELDWSYLSQIAISKSKFVEPSIYPAIHRDIALVIRQDVEANSLLRLVKKVGKDRVLGCEVFDVYQGEHIQDGYKSIALSLVYQDRNKTMTETEIQQFHQSIIDALNKEYGAELRK